MDLKLLSDDGDVLRVEMTSGIVQGDYTPDLKPFEDLLGPLRYARNVLMSMAETTLIDSRCLGWLLTIHKRFNESGGRLVMHSVRPEVLEIMSVLRFEVILSIAEDEAGALELLGGEVSRVDPESDSGNG